VNQVQGEDRVAEVARMLSGSSADVAMAHARELLAGGDGRRARSKRPARPKARAGA
jgi:hypothetical protein